MEMIVLFVIDLIQMNREVSNLSSLHPHPQHHSKQHFRVKGTAKSRQLQAISLNHSQVKHLQAIRPYYPKNNSTNRPSKHQQSPFEMSRSKSKRYEGSGRKEEHSQHGGKKMGDMLTELLHLKSEYKVLKRNYTQVLGEKAQQLKNQKSLRKAEERKNEHLRVMVKKEESMRDNLKKECYKVVQMERFRIKKLEETLQEKELMISYLRHENEQLKKGGKVDNWQSQNSMVQLDLGRPSFNLSCFSHIPEQPSKQTQLGIQEEDSLSLSRDKSKELKEELDSIIHSFLSNNEAPLQSAHNFMKKQTIEHSLEESPICNEVQPIQQTSEPSQQGAPSVALRGETEPFKAATYEVETEHRTDREVDWFRQESAASSEIVMRKRRKAKGLQIEITDQNINDQNFTTVEPSVETKRRVRGSQARPRKKIDKKKP